MKEGSENSFLLCTLSIKRIYKHFKEILKRFDNMMVRTQIHVGDSIVIVRDGTETMLLKCCKKMLLRNKIVYSITTTTIIYVIFFRLNDRSNYILDKNITKSLGGKAKIINGSINLTPMKYILLWTDPSNFPFNYFGEGRSVFLNKKCEWSNCYVTADRNFLGDYTEFDVVAFNGPQLQANLALGDLPKRRSDHQKYVYANIESSANYPVCSKTWNNFFNWTWTYKLNSDAVWGYFAIKNASNHVIGPSENIQWVIKDDTIGEDLTRRLKSKTNAVAWFASNCKTLSHREEYVQNVKYHLNTYNLEVDIYGDCGVMQCPKDVMSRCLKLLERNYYFYFAFENAISDDYVTEKVLHAVNHNTVPVVFGGANYSRFMPPEAYLNALELSPQKLAHKMFEIIQNSTLYHEFFWWKRYYSYHLRYEDPSTDDYCHFCDMINDESFIKKTTVYENFDNWWKSSISCQYLQEGSLLLEESVGK